MNIWYIHCITRKGYAEKYLVLTQRNRIGALQTMDSVFGDGPYFHHYAEVYQIKNEEYKTVIIT